MSKILIDARESGTSTGRYIDKLIEYLHKLKPEHEFVILTKSHRIDFMREIAPNFSCVISDIKEFTFAEQGSLLRQITSLKPDLVHFGMVQQPILYPGRTVTTMHDLTTIRFINPDKNPLIFKVKQWVYKLVNKRVARKSQLIMTPTEYVKNDVVQFTHINPEKVIVTYESADPITAQPEPISELQQKDFIMYVGRPTPHKNLMRLVHAFAIIKKKHPNMFLVLAGKTDANYERIAHDVQNTNIKDVFFTGFISEGQLRWLYEHTSAYVFPSLSEGFGLPGLEAMRHKAPVASSNATCLPEVYKDAARYFDPLNIEDMARVVTEVMDSPALRNKLISAGSSLTSTYSWERMAKQTLEVYEKALTL